MSEIVSQIDHQETAVELLLSQFNNSPDLQSLIKSWLLPLEDLEQTLQDWASANGVTTAEGEFLDVIGSWLGVDRGLLLDGPYRQAILAQAIISGMDGTTEKLLEGMRAVCQSDYVTFHETFPSTVYAQSGGGWNSGTYGQIKRIVAAGKDLRLLVDDKLDSMLMSEILEQDNGLVTGDLEQYVVVVEGVEYDLTTSIASSETIDSSGDYLAEQFDTSFTPMAEVVSSNNDIAQGFIIDDLGNFVIDDLNNKINYRELF